MHRKISNFFSNIVDHYNNSVTFYHQTDINHIPNDRKLVLDNYVFDVDELKDYAEALPEKLYVNPHITEGDNAFSANAIEHIRQNSVLRPFAEALDAKLAEQVEAISSESVDALIDFLENVHTRLAQHNNGDEFISIDDIKDHFLQHRSSLSEDAQQKMDDYIVSVPSALGGEQKMLFKYALDGGYNHCIQTMQIYLWQAVIAFRPDAYDRIPQQVHQMAHHAHLVIRTEQTPQTPNLTQPHPQHPTHGFIQVAGQGINIMIPIQFTQTAPGQLNATPMITPQVMMMLMAMQADINELGNDDEHQQAPRGPSS